MVGELITNDTVLAVVIAAVEPAHLPQSKQIRGLSFFFFWLGEK